jgi:hypothetical protein
MEKVNVEIHEDVVSVIEKIKNSTSSQVELYLPEGAVLFENGLNLKLIKRESERVGKTVDFFTEDENGLYLIDMIEGVRADASSSDIAEDFISREISIDEIMGVESKKKKSMGVKLPSIKAPKIKLDGFKLPSISLPRISFKSNLPLIIGGLIMLIVLGVGGYHLFWRVPKADVKIIVSSQPLIKSVEMEVRTDAKNSAEDRTLKGEVISTTVKEEVSVETTGQKIVGEKAKGRIRIINRTTEDKDFDKGEELYSKDDSDLVYILDDDVTVPGGTSEIPVNPSDPVVITPGNAEADVIAKEIGKDYNIDSGETLKFDDYSSSNYIAEVVEDVDGGSSDTLSIVAQEDLDSLIEKIAESVGTKGADSLKNSVKGDQKFVDGSESESLSEETYTASLGDETDEVSLSRTYLYQGLTYNDSELSSLLDTLLEGFVPDGFELSEEDTEVNVEVLGNTDATTLTTTQADLQVTLKSFVIPKLDKDSLKEQLVGIKLVDAQKILGGVRNIRTYELNLNPNIPLLQRMPSNIVNISIDLEKE